MHQSRPIGSTFAERELKRLRSCVSQIDDFQGEVARELKKSESRKSYHELALVEASSAMSYRAHRFVLGLLVNLRNEQIDCDQFLVSLSLVDRDSQTLASDKEVVQALRELLTLDGGENQKDFARDAIVLIRASYPFGVNMLSPKWTSNEGRHTGADPALIRLHRDLSVWVFDDRITLEIRGKVEQTQEMEPGLSYIIGRPLGVRPGGKESRRVELPVDVYTTSEYLTVSRAALLVVNTEDGRYYFDRGSRNDAAIEIGGERHNYRPVVIPAPSPEDPFESLSLGMTLIDQPFVTLDRLSGLRGSGLWDLNLSEGLD